MQQPIVVNTNASKQDLFNAASQRLANLTDLIGVLSVALEKEGDRPAGAALFQISEDLGQVWELLREYQRPELKTAKG